MNVELFNFVHAESVSVQIAATVLFTVSAAMMLYGTTASLRVIEGAIKNTPSTQEVHKGQRLLAVSFIGSAGMFLGYQGMTSMFSAIPIIQLAVQIFMAAIFLGLVVYLIGYRRWAAATAKVRQLERYGVQ